MVEGKECLFVLPVQEHFQRNFPVMVAWHSVTVAEFLSYCNCHYSCRLQDEWQHTRNTYLVTRSESKQDPSRRTSDMQPINSIKQFTRKFSQVFVQRVGQCLVGIHRTKEEQVFCSCSSFCDFEEWSQEVLNVMIHAYHWVSRRVLSFRLSPHCYS